MKFKVGDKVKTVVENNRYFHEMPIGTIGIISNVDKFDKMLPYEITVKDYKCWFDENELTLVEERSEETEMPKQKDLYDFDNMTDDDLDRLISEANDVLISRKKDCMLGQLDDAINAMKEFLQFDDNCAMTSEGYSTVDILNELKELRAYYN